MQVTLVARPRNHEDPTKTAICLDLGSGFFDGKTLKFLVPSCLKAEKKIKSSLRPYGEEFLYGKPRKLKQ